ncbi:hypothetical protein FGO68_gene12668 [Halteria grandinella]|uniref:Histidine kinase n=1 Tax=Halteria grandinella TaxID=5974 RepID=A0A8J8NXU2_HALGN|nr:hypothetical protein FGO68_gene12668 [Halteria grandinella]
MKRVKQILFNLLGNAIKFTFSGSITVRIDYDTNNQILKGEIIDTGLGIQKQDLNKLFRFFGTLAMTKDINRGGMGLGLTISKMIVQSLGGDISVMSEPGIETQTQIPRQHVNGDISNKNGEQVYLPQHDLSPVFNSNNSEQSNFGYMRRTLSHSQLSSEAIFESEEDIMTEAEEQGTMLSMKTNAKQSLNELYRSHLSSIMKAPITIGREKVQLEEIKITFVKEEKLRVLCVDDSTYNLFVIKEMLKIIDSKMNIETALNGQIAFDKVYDAHQVQTHDHPRNQYFNLMLLDLHMPLLDGFQTAKQIRESVQGNKMSLGKLRIYALSAITEAQFINNPYSRYFDGFLEKPVSSQKLQNVLESCM